MNSTPITRENAVTAKPTLRAAAAAALLALLVGCDAVHAYGAAWASGGSAAGRIERGPGDPYSASSWQRLYGPSAAARNAKHSHNH